MKDTPLTTFLFWTLVLTIYIFSKFAPRKTKLKANAQIFLATSVAVTGGLLVLVGFGYLAYQITQWLRQARWYDFSAIDVLRNIFNSNWLENPNDWIGVHSLLQSCPA